MPRLLEDELNSKTINAGSGTTFEYSAIHPEKLGAVDTYTLATIAVDVSGSVCGHEDHILEALKTSVKALKRSPHSEHIILRVIVFNTSITEVHGFKPISNIDVDSEYSRPNTGGGTSLNDAYSDTILSVSDYNKQLYAMDYICNGICIVITDGGENCSRKTSFDDVKNTIINIKQDEKLDSLITMLIAVNDSSDYVRDDLNAYKDSVGITHFVSTGDLSTSAIAKLGNIVSQSISSQSQSLSTGNSTSIDDLII